MPPAILRGVWALTALRSGPAAAAVPVKRAPCTEPPITAVKCDRPHTGAMSRVTHSGVMGAIMAWFRLVVPAA